MNDMKVEEITIKALEIAESKTDVRHIQELISDSCEEMAEWMQEQKQAEIDGLNNQLSVLTEQLDANNIFCEGVRDLMTERAWDWFCENFDRYKKIKSLAEGVKLAVEFKKAMKGE